MSFEVLITSDFKRDSKSLLKKYKSLKTEILDLIASLEEDPTQGTPLGIDCYKIRLAIKSKGKGKSGGARVITCVKVVDGFVTCSLSTANQRRITSLIKNYKSLSKIWNDYFSYLICQFNRSKSFKVNWYFLENC